MDNFVSQIRIKYIPAIFPTAGYTDFKFIEGRVIRTMESEPILDVTEKKYKTVFNPEISDNISIQSVMYTKHYLEFVVNESINVDLLKIGDEVEIIDENGVRFKAKYISSNSEKQADTFIYICKFEFYKIVNNSNAVSNYLTYGFISQRVLSLASLYCFKIRAYKDIDSNFLQNDELSFYTAIIPTFTRSEKKILFNEYPNGKKLESASFDCGLIDLRFYLTETEKNNLIAYCNRCFNPLYPQNLRLTSPDTTTYDAIEVPEIEVNDKDLIDIYEVNVRLKYNEINFYNYGNV